MLASHAAAGTCTGTPEKPDEASVRKVEAQWVKAFVTGDTAYLDCLLEPDYESVWYTGEVRSRQQIIDKAAAHRDHPLAVPEIKPGIVQLHGNGAIYRSDHEMTDPVTHEKTTVRFLDILVYDQGAWHVMYTQDVALNSPAKPQTAGLHR